MTNFTSPKAFSATQFQFWSFISRVRNQLYISRNGFSQEKKKYSLNVSADDVKEEKRKTKENYSGVSIFLHAFIHPTLFFPLQTLNFLF